MTSRLLRHLSFVFLCAILMAGVARAQDCSFSVTPIEFGSVDILSGAAVDATGELRVTCTPGLLTNVRACISLGTVSGGTTTAFRQMRNASANATLDFDIFRDAGHSSPWGSVYMPGPGSPIAIDFTGASGSRTETRTIYARIPPNQQTAPAGAYTALFSSIDVVLSSDRYTVIPRACTNISGNQRRGQFPVRATIMPNCRVTAQNIDFGNHGVLDSAVDATGGLDISCTSGTSYNVALNNGLNGTSPVDRRMTLGEQSVSYGLYMDPARAQPWGSSANQQLSGTGTGTTANVPVYGRVPPQLTPAPGTYTDTVVVTVTY